MLIIGFGRFGQIVSQCLLTQGVDVTAVDIDTEMIDAAGRFGFKVYYGDGARLDVLRAAGAGRVPMIAVCVDDRERATQSSTSSTSNSPTPSSMCAPTTAATRWI